MTKHRMVPPLSIITNHLTSMKAKLFLVLVITVLALLQANSQEFPPKHRGMHPRLLKDGKVVDEKGASLGYITNDGKVCDVSGKTIGIISDAGDVTAASGKVVGKTQKDGSFKSKKGHVYSLGGDGGLMVAGKMVGHVDKAYKDKSHACILHCFFNQQNEDSEEIDHNIHH